MQSPLETALFLVVLIISIILHEVAHGYAANALGDPTARLAGRLTLNPLAHIDPLGSIVVPALLLFSGGGFLFGWAKPVPYNPYNLRNQRWGDALVAVAGPATNLLLAFLFALIVRLATLGYVPETAGTFAASVTLINLYLGFFNLLPIPPMDGYTTLRGILPFSWSYPLRDFENQIRSWGASGLIIVLILFSFVLAQPFSAFVSFIFSALVGG